ncbi:Uncharacterized protein HZ326_31400 [Fusarium oxysporum f. sp. albedinis]|nr:Uncharacterized protein HZ326_31400 [Fusarium oxysporum f. sp. albedinis]
MDGILRNRHKCCTDVLRNIPPNLTESLPRTSGKIKLDVENLLIGQDGTINAGRVKRTNKKGKDQEKEAQSGSKMKGIANKAIK